MSINREQLETQLVEIARRRQIAQQMAQPQERIQQAGGLVVPYSAGEGLAQLGQAFFSQRANKKLDEREATARGQHEAGRAGVMAQMQPQPGQAAPDLTPQFAQQAIDYGIDPSVISMLKKPQAEAYTLGPGEQRFGGDNQPMASVTPKPEQPQPQGPLVEVMTPSGPRLVSREEAINQTPYHAPAAQPASEPLVSVVDPATGRPKLVPRSQASNMEPYQRPTGGLTPRDATTAKNKLTQIAVARQQLQTVKDTWEKLKGTGAAGPWWSGQGALWSPEAASNFDTAVDSARNALSSITRVPGIGSMSDFETRLAQAQFPERGKFESSTTQQIESLDNMLNQLEQGYSGLLQDTGAATEAPQGPMDFSQMSEEELLRLAGGQ